MPDTADAYTHRIGRTGRAAKTGDAFTFVTREDEDMVRSIERVLGEKIERRKLAGFDYSKPAPSRDTEFARPPREPQRRRVQERPPHAAAHKPATAPHKAHQAHPASGVAHRGPAPHHTPGSTTHTSRTPNSRTYR